MIVPKLVTQVRLLITNLPAYLENLNARSEKWLGEHGGDGPKSAKDTASAITALPSVSTIINSVGQYSIQLFQNLLLIIFFFLPGDLYAHQSEDHCSGYIFLIFLTAKRTRLRKHFLYASKMTIGWMWSNIVAGTIRAVIVWFFFILWVSPGYGFGLLVTFFAELIPKIGFYIMAVPPILIAFLDLPDYRLVG